MYNPSEQFLKLQEESKKTFTKFQEDVNKDLLNKVYNRAREALRQNEFSFKESYHFFGSKTYEEPPGIVDLLNKVGFTAYSDIECRSCDFSCKCKNNNCILVSFSPDLEINPEHSTEFKQLQEDINKEFFEKVFNRARDEIRKGSYSFTAHFYFFGPFNYPETIILLLKKVGFEAELTVECRSCDFVCKCRNNSIRVSFYPKG